MNTFIASSPGGTQIAYDRTWHRAGDRIGAWRWRHAPRVDKAGYVTRLRGNSTVIALDLCSYGKSNLSIDPAAYTTDRTGQDILTVAEACGIERSIVWGISYGGNVGRLSPPS